MNFIYTVLEQIVKTRWTQDLTGIFQLVRKAWGLPDDSSTCTCKLPILLNRYYWYHALKKGDKADIKSNKVTWYHTKIEHTETRTGIINYENRFTINSVFDD